MRYLIDVPGPFASKPCWQLFLAEMLALPQDDPQVRDAISQAREALKALEGDPV